MPIYQYRCRKNGHLIDMTGSVERCAVPITCPQCGDWADRIISQVNFVNSPKQWRGRKEVNFEIEDGQEVFKKQLKAAAEGGSFEKMQHRTKRTSEQMRIYKKSLERRMKNTPPVKVADSPSFSIREMVGE